MTYEQRQRAKAESLAKATKRPLLEELPKGWKRLPTGSLTTAPVGYYWASNGESLFSKRFKSALVKE